MLSSLELLLPSNYLLNVNFVILHVIQNVMNKFNYKWIFLLIGCQHACMKLCVGIFYYLLSHNSILAQTGKENMLDDLCSRLCRAVLCFVWSVWIFIFSIWNERLKSDAIDTMTIFKSIIIAVFYVCVCVRPSMGYNNPLFIFHILLPMDSSIWIQCGIK